jgi:GWxTD domain-containing protein
VGALLLLGPSLPAQGNRVEERQAHELIAQARQLLQTGDTTTALERLEAATKAAPNLSEAHYRYGQVLVRLADNGLDDFFERRRAASALGRALDLDPGNPAILLEYGRLRLKDSFLRIEAQRSFKRALEAAEKRNQPALIAEVRAEIGDIYYRRYQSQANRRMIVGGALRFDYVEALSDPHYTKHFLETQTAAVPDAGELDLRTAEEHYRAGVSAYAANEAAATGILGLLYDRGRYEEFLEVARVFTRAAPRSGKAQLLHGLGLWRVGRNRESMRAFDKALDFMSPADLATVSDISVILRRTDAHNYEALTDLQRAEYERRYWFLADPLRLSEENEHRLEHLARVAYADLRYSAPALHLRGWQTDRGVIYIRYGPPPVIATFPPDTRPTGGGPLNVIPEPEALPGPGGSYTRAMGDPSMVGKVVTVWFYPERNLRFVFFGPPAYNFAKFAGDFKAYADDARYSIPVKYDNVPVNDALDSVAVQPAAFRAASGATEVVFFAGIPVSRLVAGTDVDRGQLETGFFVTEPQLTDVVARRESEIVSFQARQQFEARTYEVTLAPGAPRTHLVGRSPGRPGRATERHARRPARLLPAPEPRDDVRTGRAYSSLLGGLPAHCGFDRYRPIRRRDRDPNSVAGAAGDRSARDRWGPRCGGCHGPRR